MYETKLILQIKNILDNYFNLISWTGFTEASVPNKIGVLIGIEEMINSPMSAFINDTDYKRLQNVITCILGSECIMPVMTGDDYFTGDSMNMEDMILRISEEDAFRLSSSGMFRIPDFI